MYAINDKGAAIRALQKNLMLIGDDEKAAAEALLQLIAERFPHIAIGKETI